MTVGFYLFEDYIRGAVAVAPPKDNYPFQMTDGEAAVAGTVYKYSAGKLTACGATDAPHVVVIENAPATTPGAKVRGYYVTPGMVFRAPLVGTNILTVGIRGAKATSAGDGIDATVATGGKWSVLRISESDGVVYVTPTESLFH